MNTKARLLFLAVAAILLLGATQMLSAGVTVSVTGSTSIAPSSIPVPESGTVIVGMNRVTLFGGGNGSTSMASMDVQLISSPGFNAADIQSIKVYWEASGGNGLYDNGAVFDDFNALSGGPYTFSSGLATITLNSGICTMTDGQTARLYVAVELKSTAVYSGDTIGVQTISVTQSGKGPMSVTGHGVQKPLDKYRVTPTVTGDAPVGGYTFQGESASMIKLFFDPVDNDASAKIRLATVKVHQVGSPWLGEDDNLNSGGVVLYEDTDSSGTWNAADAQVTSATLGSPTLNYATLTLSTPAVIPAAGKTFFVVVNIALLATVDDEVELQIANPSTDITFADAYSDDLVGADYAYIPAGAPYLQKGYLTGTSIVPAGSNATVVEFQSTPPKPIVSSIDPGNSAANVQREAAIHATFSKNMLAASITTDTFKLFDGAVEVPGSVTFDGTVNATFTPSSLLNWGTTYTVRIISGAAGVEATDDPKDMDSDKVWSFTTEFAVYPTVLSTSPMNAQIEVPRATTVTATFSKDINPTSIISPATTFRLNDGTSYVTGTVTYDAPSRTATFTQTTPPLAFGTIYTASISTDATDTDGLVLQSAHIWTFTTTAPVYPLVSVTTPTGGQSEVPLTDNLTATFSKDMNSASVIANFKLYNAALVEVGADVTWDAPSWTATLNPTPTLNWGEVYTAKVLAAATSVDSLQMLSDKVWTFTTTAPVYPIVTLTAPANGDNEVSRTTTVAATFSKSMNPTTLDSPATTFQVFKDNNSNTLYDAGDVLIAGAVAYVEGSKTATFTQTSPPLDWGTRYTVRISTAATAADGLAMESAKVWTFTTVMPNWPIVVSRTPVVGEVEVDIGSNITATFSKDIDASSIVDNTTVLVFEDANANHLYDALIDTLASSDATRTAARVVTIDPAAALEWNTTYYVNFTTGVRDTDGLYLQSVAWWYFTTKVPVNPIVSNTVPAPDATGVVPAATVTVSFSKDMQEADTEAAFSLHVGDAAGALVPGTASLGSPQVLTFTPASPLTPGQKYTAIVEGNGGAGSARAVDGLYMLLDKSWSFWVSSRPEVLLSSPAEGSMGVSRTTTIKAVFSKNIQDITGSSDKFLVEDGTGTPVIGDVTYDDTTFTATFAPEADLLFSSYTVTIKAGPTGVLSSDGIQMAGDESWTFTTIPSLTEPVAANNKLTPSSSSPVTIFVPQPPQGAADRVTVQVFTATGKKVATLVNNVAWSTFQASLPIEWNGRNDLGEPLGPGLYFIQIRATGYLRTLKVMIVR